MFISQERMKNLENELKQIRKYIQAEINVLDKVKSYKVRNELMKQFPERLKMVILKAESKNLRDYNYENKEDMFNHRKLYLNRIAKELDATSQVYFPHDNLYWATLGKTLKRLSSDIRKKI